MEVPSTGSSLRQIWHAGFLKRAWFSAKVFSRITGGLTALLVLSLALLLRMHCLTDVSFWFDEACSWRISQFPLLEMWSAISRDAHPPLFYLLQKIWQQVAGSTVLAARSLSVLLGMAVVVAAWRLASAMADDTEPLDSPRLAEEVTLLPAAPASCIDGGGFGRQRQWPFLAFTAILVALSPLHVELSQEARPYSLGTCLALLAGAALLQAVKHPANWKYWMCFWLAATLLSFTHYYGLLTVAALLLFGIGEAAGSAWRAGWTTRTKQLTAGICCAAWGLQLCWIPWLSTFLWQRQRTDTQLWMHPLEANECLQIGWSALAGGKTSEVWPPWTWMAGVVWIGVPTLLLWTPRRGGRLAALCIVVPILGSVAYSLSIRNILGVRYLVFAQVYLLAGSTFLIAQMRLRLLRVLFMACALAWSGYWCWKYAEQRNYYASASGLRGAMDFLDQVRQADAPVIVSSPFIYPVAIQYLHEPRGVMVQYRHDHLQDLLAGPCLRAEDYAGVSRMLQSGHYRIWTVDAVGLFGGNAAVRLPERYELASESRFPEGFGIPMDVLVREYRRRASPNAHEGSRISAR